MSSNQSVSTLRILGAILLIVGTSIGGGMLALPIATAALGFFPAIFYLIITWFLMAMGAFYILEVNAWCPLDSNLITMAGVTIGRVGQGLAWVAYLLLLYSLLAAYVAGGQDVVATVLGDVGINVSFEWSALIFILLFGLVVVLGIRSVDLVNRLVMIIKLATYLLMIGTTLPFIKLAHLTGSPVRFSVTLSTLMIMITSYGFAIIVPSLRTYFADNIAALKKSVIIGSFIPLICYLVWEAVIFSVLPKTGEYSLHALAVSKQPVSTLMHVLSHISQNTWIIVVANIFTSVCVITAFLGVSLCMVDFLADGLKLRKRGASAIFIYGLTFVPPLLLAIFAQKVFVLALSFAGIICVFLLMLLPAWMAWVGRYKRKFKHEFEVFGGKPLLIISMLVAVLLLLVEIITKAL